MKEIVKGVESRSLSRRVYAECLEGGNAAEGQVQVHCVSALDTSSSCLCCASSSPPDTTSAASLRLCGSG